MVKTTMSLIKFFDSVLSKRLVTSAVTFPEKSAKLGVSFSPAGLLTPYHLGVSHELTQLGLLGPQTALSGASGGALAAATSALNINQKDALYACEYVAERCRSEGTRSTLRLALDEVLLELIPDNAAEKLSARPAKCLIAFTELYPTVTAHVVDSYNNRNDLIDVLRASCNIPFYFNGNWPCVKVRDVYAVDGFFAIERTRFGCPPTGAHSEIIVAPFRPSLVGLKPQITERTKKFHILSPALLKKGKFPFTMMELLQFALGPPPSTQIVEERCRKLLENGIPVSYNDRPKLGKLPPLPLSSKGESVSYFDVSRILTSIDEQVRALQLLGSSAVPPSTTSSSSSSTSTTRNGPPTVPSPPSTATTAKGRDNNNNNANTNTNANMDGDYDSEGPHFKGMTTRESYDMLFEAGVDTVKEWCQTHHKEVELLVHELQLEEKEAALAGKKADALV